MLCKWVAILTMIAITLFSAGVVLAASGFTSEVPSHVSIVVVTPSPTPSPEPTPSPAPTGGGPGQTATPTPEPDYTISLWQDVQCSMLATEIEWGNVPANTERHSTMYVLNEGNQEVDITVASDLSPDVGFITSGPLTLMPGGLGLLDIKLLTTEHSLEGSYNFTISVSSM